MDTLFEKDKYIVGNTCNHIFTYGYFVQIITMRSKSETGTISDRINQDVEVENEIAWIMHPRRLVTPQKIREWEGCKEWMSAPTIHTIHGKIRPKV